MVSWLLACVRHCSLALIHKHNEQWRLWKYNFISCATDFHYAVHNILDELKKNLVTYWGQIMSLQWCNMKAFWHLNWSSIWLFVQRLEQASNKDTTKLCITEPLCWESLDHCIFHTNGHHWGECFHVKMLSCHWSKYRQVSNTRHTSEDNLIDDHSDVVGASPVSAAPTTSSFSA